MGEEKVPHIGDEVEEVGEAPASETIKVCVYVDANDYYELKSYVARERMSVSEWARTQMREFLSKGTGGFKNLLKTAELVPDKPFILKIERKE